MKVAAFNYQMPNHSNFSKYTQYVEECVTKAHSLGAELILFPEYGSIELVSLMDKKIQKKLNEQLEEIQKYREEFLNLYLEQAKKFQIHIVLPSFPWKLENGSIVNRAYVVSEKGIEGYQEKNMMTRFENEEWQVSKGEGIQKVFEFKNIKFGINICYDVEFPDFARKLCSQGVKLILAPSCTEALKGMNRVHVGARARALENQCFVVVSQTTGSVEYSEAIDLNTGMVAAYATPDLGFSDDGIIFQSNVNEAGFYLIDLDFAKIDHVRSSGSVFNFSDIKNLPENASHK